MSVHALSPKTFVVVILAITVALLLLLRRSAFGL